MRKQDDTGGIEWQTVLIVALSYGGWIAGTTVLAGIWLPAGFVAATLAIALHSSLSHEVLHGHPFRNAVLNQALVFPAIGLFIPYQRFRDTHLVHHLDENLTDPYDDPESNYMDPEVWARLGPGWRVVLRFNNTLAGRILIGPAVSLAGFVRGDITLVRQGDRAVRNAWLWHFAGLVPVIWWMRGVMEMPVWLYVLAAYAGFSILKIRTYLEHRANDGVPGRTVVIESRGFFAFMFLNNNFHIVHHSHPGVPWYRLPDLYEANRQAYLELNEGYVFKSYREVFALYFLRAKDPVPHPLWRG
jgi:fatty acid desaturase